jgi:uncharacterized protein YqgV (UPF0045/DUF77 family)
MKVSVEISMYPLGREYIPDIQDFIDRIKSNEKLNVEINGMSTQIFGEYHEIMNTLTIEMGISFQNKDASVFVMKIINAHLKKD